MIREWAELNRFHWKLDECRDVIIPGKLGHLYEHSDTQLGAFLEYSIKSRLSMRTMRSRQRQVEALGFKAKQTADGEGTWLLPIDLDPKSPLLARLLRILKIYKIRQATGKPFEKRQP